jgi:hypothetical protein
MSTPISYTRPLGVTIRGLFYIIEGAIAIFCGLLLLTTTHYIETYLNKFSERQEISMLLQIFDSSLSQVLIIWLIVADGAGIIIGIGVLKGKKWAWKITIIQTLSSVAVGITYFMLQNTPNLASKIIGMSFELIIGMIIVYYFYQPHVRAYFNRVSRQ